MIKNISQQDSSSPFSLLGITPKLCSKSQYGPRKPYTTHRNRREVSFTPLHVSFNMIALPCIFRTAALGRDLSSVLQPGRECSVWTEWTPPWPLASVPACAASALLSPQSPVRWPRRPVVEHEWPQWPSYYRIPAVHGPCLWIWDGAKLV